MKNPTLYKTKNIYLLLIIILALSGFIIQSFTTTLGVGIGPDASCYIGAARNLLSNHSLSIPFGHALSISTSSMDRQDIPLTHFAPLFSILLSILGLIGIDPLDGAKFLNGILFSANIFLVGVTIYRSTAGHWASLFGSLLMLSCVDMLMIHSNAWSEPLYIFLTLIGFLFLASYIDKSKKTYLITSALMIALSTLARYVGIISILSGLVGLLLFSKNSRNKKIADCAIYAFVVSTPITLWFFRNLFLTTTFANREISFHPISLDALKMACSTLSSWLFPWGQSLSFKLSLLLITTVFLILSLIKWRAFAQRKENLINHTASTYTDLLFIFCFFYIITLACSLTFIDALTPLNFRILSPFFAANLIIFLSLVSKRTSAPWRRILGQTFIFLVCITLCGSYMSKSIPWVLDSYENGIGFNAKTWQESELIKTIRMLPPKVPIYSNGPDAIYMLTGKRTMNLPSRIRATSSKTDYDFDKNLRKLNESLLHENGKVVYFNNVTWRSFLLTQDELNKLLPLRIFNKFSDGIIFEIDRSGFSTQAQTTSKAKQNINQ